MISVLIEPFSILLLERIKISWGKTLGIVFIKLVNSPVVYGAKKDPSALNQA